MKRFFLVRLACVLALASVTVVNLFGCGSSPSWVGTPDAAFSADGSTTEPGSDGGTDSPAGEKEGPADPGTARLRFMNLVPPASSLDVCLLSTTASVVEPLFASKKLPPVSFQKASAYFTVPAGDITLAVVGQGKPCSQSEPTTTIKTTLKRDSHSTLTMSGGGFPFGEPAVAVFEDDLVELGQDRKIRLLSLGSYFKNGVDVAWRIGVSTGYTTVFSGAPALGFGTSPLGALSKQGYVSTFVARSIGSTFGIKVSGQPVRVGAPAARYAQALQPVDPAVDWLEWRNFTIVELGWDEGPTGTNGQPIAIACHDEGREMTPDHTMSDCIVFLTL